MSMETSKRYQDRKGKRWPRHVDHLTVDDIVCGRFTETNCIIKNCSIAWLQVCTLRQ